MKLTLLLFVIVFTAAKKEGNKKESICKEGLKVNNIHHETEILAHNLSRPYQLSYYKHGHEIYFSCNSGKDEEDTFEIRCWKKNEKLKTIETVKNGFATAIDETSKIIYFGGSEGIYKKNMSDGDHAKTSQILERFNIWDMFFKHHLYFIRYPSQRLYKYCHGEKPKVETPIHGKIYQFAIDGQDDKFITNDTGLFMVKNESNHAHFITGAKVYRCIEVNNKGVVHFCGQNDIYGFHKHNNSLYTIAEVKNIFGLTFDTEDNMIYSDAHRIIKILPELCKTPK